MSKKQVVIVVRGGAVEEIYTNFKDGNIVVLDKDVQDEDSELKLEGNMKKLEALLKQGKLRTFDCDFRID